MKRVYVLSRIVLFVHDAEVAGFNRESCIDWHNELLFS